MHRTEAQGSVAGEYFDRNLPTTAGTLLEASDRNTIQEEIANLIEAAGLTLKDKVTETNNQLVETFTNPITTFISMDAITNGEINATSGDRTLTIKSKLIGANPSVYISMSDASEEQDILIKHDAVILSDADTEETVTATAASTVFEKAGATTESNTINADGITIASTASGSATAVMTRGSLSISDSSPDANGYIGPELIAVVNNTEQLRTGIESKGLKFSGNSNPGIDTVVHRFYVASLDIDDIVVAYDTTGTELPSGASIYHKSGVSLSIAGGILTTIPNAGIILGASLRYGQYDDTIAVSPVRLQTITDGTTNLEISSIHIPGENETNISATVNPTLTIHYDASGI